MEGNVQDVLSSSPNSLQQKSFVFIFIYNFMKPLNCNIASGLVEVAKLGLRPLI